jgi:hypothetical protein
MIAQLVKFSQKFITGFMRMLFNALPRHTIHFLNIHFNIILPYSHRPSEWNLSLPFSDQKFSFLLSPNKFFYPFLTTFHSYMVTIWWRQWNYELCYFINLSITSSLLKPTFSSHYCAITLCFSLTYVNKFQTQNMSNCVLHSLIIMYFHIRDKKVKDKLHISWST